MSRSVVHSSWVIGLTLSLLVAVVYADSREDEILRNMEELLETGVEKLNEGLLSEGMKRLVSVLAEKQKLSRSFPQAEEVAQAAQIELAKLQTSIALEADPVWLDDSMNQKVGSTLNIELGPVVILTWRTTTGRSLISNAPIRFEFIKGSGTVTEEVNTNSYGQASCGIGSFAQPQKEQVIRASLQSPWGALFTVWKVCIEIFFMPPRPTERPSSFSSDPNRESLKTHTSFHPFLKY